MLIEKEIFVYGVIISIGSGVVTLQGFLMAFVGEVFRICSMGLSESTFGLVVNLYRDETMNLLIGGLLFNPEARVSEGAKVNGMSRLATMLLGDFAIGSILDPIGNFILNQERIDAQYRWVIESPAPGIIDRQSVFEPLQTGILSVDSMVPIGVVSVSLSLVIVRLVRHLLVLIPFLTKSSKRSSAVIFQLVRRLHQSSRSI